MWVYNAPKNISVSERRGVGGGVVGAVEPQGRLLRRGGDSNSLLSVANAHTRTRRTLCTAWEVQHSNKSFVTRLVSCDTDCPMSSATALLKVLTTQQRRTPPVHHLWSSSSHRLWSACGLFRLLRRSTATSGAMLVTWQHCSATWLSESTALFTPLYLRTRPTLAELHHPMSNLRTAASVHAQRSQCL